MTPDLFELFQEFSKAEAVAGELKRQLKEETEAVQQLQEQIEIKTKARFAVTEVAKQTQKKFQDVVESLITTAIRSVYDRDLRFALVFDTRYNKTDCNPVVIETVDGKEVVYEDLSDDLGGGLIDIISLAFRIVLWHLEEPKSRNVILLDEPLKNMGKLVTVGAQVLREISHDLGLQLIVASHEDELIEAADSFYHVSHDGVCSKVIAVKEAACAEKKKICIRRTTTSD